MKLKKLISPASICIEEISLSNSFNPAKLISFSKMESHTRFRAEQVHHSAIDIPDSESTLSTEMRIIVLAVRASNLPCQTQR